jgi:hypothetical protein
MSSMTSTTVASKKKPVRVASPLTTEVTYTAREQAYLKAVEAFKSETGRQFPTACDFLRIADGLDCSMIAN